MEATFYMVSDFGDVLRFAWMFLHEIATKRGFPESQLPSHGEQKSCKGEKLIHSTVSWVNPRGKNETICYVAGQLCKNNCFYFSRDGNPVPIVEQLNLRPTNTSQ